MSTVGFYTKSGKKRQITSSSGKQKMKRGHFREMQTQIPGLDEALAYTEQAKQKEASGNPLASEEVQRISEIGVAIQRIPTASLSAEDYAKVDAIATNLAEIVQISQQRVGTDQNNPDELALTDDYGSPWSGDLDVPTWG